MGRYMRKCKRSRQAAEKKTPEIGARMTRASTAQKSAEKKRKVGSGESELSSPSERCKTRLIAAVSPENSASPAASGNSTCASGSSDRVLASCCSSNGSSELAKGSTNFVDLEEENVEFLATSAVNLEDSRQRRGSTPSSEVQAELGELESTARPRDSNFSRRFREVKMPSEAELEEFFSVAEKNLQKQFIDKYNYDIAKDEPLEGRYEWVQLQVKP